MFSRQSKCHGVGVLGSKHVKDAIWKSITSTREGRLRAQQGRSPADLCVVKPELNASVCLAHLHGVCTEQPRVLAGNLCRAALRREKKKQLCKLSASYKKHKIQLE